MSNPVELPDFGHVTQVAAGWDFSFALTSNNMVSKHMDVPFSLVGYEVG